MLQKHPCMPNDLTYVQTKKNIHGIKSMICWLLILIELSVVSLHTKMGCYFYIVLFYYSQMVIETAFLQKDPRAHDNATNTKLRWSYLSKPKKRTFKAVLSCDICCDNCPNLWWLVDYTYNANKQLSFVDVFFHYQIASSFEKEFVLAAKSDYIWVEAGNDFVIFKTKYKD